MELNRDRFRLGHAFGLTVQETLCPLRASSLTINDQQFEKTGYVDARRGVEAGERGEGRQDGLATASERGGNILQRFKDFGMETETRFWPGLS